MSRNSPPPYTLDSDSDAVLELRDARGLRLLTQVDPKRPDPTLAWGAPRELAFLLGNYGYEELGLHLESTPTVTVGLLLSDTCTAALLRAAAVHGCAAVYSTPGSSLYDLELQTLGFQWRGDLNAWRWTPAPENP